MAGYGGWTWNITIQGLQQAQADNLRRQLDMKPTGAFGRLVFETTRLAHLFAVSDTHVITGALRASHRMQVNGLYGRVYIDPSAVNPLGDRPVQYGPVEELRGGSHRFYGRVVTEHWLELSERVGKMAAVSFRLT